MAVHIKQNGYRYTVYLGTQLNQVQLWIWRRKETRSPAGPTLSAIIDREFNKRGCLCDSIMYNTDRDYYGNDLEDMRQYFCRNHWARIMTAIVAMDN